MGFFSPAKASEESNHSSMFNPPALKLCIAPPQIVFLSMVDGWVFLCPPRSCPMGPSLQQLDTDTAVFDVLLHPHLPLPTVSHHFWVVVVAGQSLTWQHSRCNHELVTRPEHATFKVWCFVTTCHKELIWNRLFGCALRSTSNYFAANRSSCSHSSSRQTWVTQVLEMLRHWNAISILELYIHTQTYIDILLHIATWYCIDVYAYRYKYNLFNIYIYIFIYINIML